MVTFNGLISNQKQRRGFPKKKAAKGADTMEKKIMDTYFAPRSCFKHLICRSRVFLTANRPRLEINGKIAVRFALQLLHLHA